jgi:hypothetical protein
MGAPRPSASGEGNTPTEAATAEVVSLAGRCARQAPMATLTVHRALHDATRLEQGDLMCATRTGTGTDRARGVHSCGAA